MILDSIKIPSKLDRINAAFAAKENALIVEYARSVIQGLILIYKDATVTNDKTLNLILGRAPFVREIALALVMNHDVYSDLRKRGYEVNFWYDEPQQELPGLTLRMGKPPEDDTQIALAKVEEYNERNIQVQR